MYQGLCPQNLELRWMTEVTSSIYATPLITDLYSDGQKDIIVPSFVHHLEVLPSEILDVTICRVIRDQAQCASTKNGVPNE